MQEGVLRWRCVRPNAIVTVVALYDELLITHTYPPDRIEMGNLLIRAFEYFKDSIIQTETPFFLPAFAFNIEKNVQPRKKVRTGLNLFKLNAS